MTDEHKRRDATYVPLSETFFEEAEVYPSDKEHLLRSLHGLERELAPTPSFPLYDTTDAQQVIQDFLDKYVLSNSSIPSWMKEYETSRLKKVGPQGGHKSWDELKPLFDLYQERYSEKIDVPEETMEYMLNKYSKLRCKVLSNEDSLRTLKRDKRIESRAAGCRRFALKKTDHEAQVFALLDLASGLIKYFFGYVFSRYNKLKLRLFMPMPFSDMIREAKWFSPFLHTIQEDLRQFGADSPFVFWADKLGFPFCFDCVDVKVRRNKDGSFTTIVYVQRDFEKMDTTTGPEQQKLSTHVMASAFGYAEGSQSYRKLEEAMLFPVKCPIATPSGMMIGDHGMASGATTTNGSETVNNDAFDHTAVTWIEDKCATEGIEVRLAISLGNGDDGASVWLLKDPNDLEEFKSILSEGYAYSAEKHGFISQTSKWDISTERGLYCQNFFWYEDNRIKWAYPATLILNSIMNPEHQYSSKDWDKDFRDLDIIQKLDNGRGLPYFAELVHFVDNGMKYRLFGDKSDDTVNRILSKYERYRALQPLAERYNREDWTPVKSPSLQLILADRNK